MNLHHNSCCESDIVRTEERLILLVEDNLNILEGNRYFLEKAGYKVITSSTIAQARAFITGGSVNDIPISLMILDILLPDGNGLQFLREIRRYSDLPVLLLTGLSESDDVVRGLAEGGDDYLPKPYNFAVLLARVNALLRRSPCFPGRIKRGALELDIISGQAFLADENLLLTPKQFALLLLLVQGKGKILSNAQLYENVWKQPLTNDCNALWKQMSRLKSKLSDRDGIFLTQYRGEGYSLEFFNE